MTNTVTFEEPEEKIAPALRNAAPRRISKKITSSTGANVVFGSITDDMENDAEYLLALCETLHAGDSQILAYARATKTTLITCDKGLAAAAKFCGVNVVNPDTLPCDQITNKVKIQLIKNIK